MAMIIETLFWVFLGFGAGLAVLAITEKIISAQIERYHLRKARERRNKRITACGDD